MARYSDNAPIGHTCPKIDTVISFLDGIDCEEIHPNDIKTIINVMEEIRSANSTLRDWGNDLCRQVDELQGEVDDEIRRNDKLQDEISDLKSEIKDLQLELSDAVSQIGV